MQAENKETVQWPTPLGLLALFLLLRIFITFIESNLLARFSGETRRAVSVAIVEAFADADKRKSEGDKSIVRSCPYLSHYYRVLIYIIFRTPCSG